VQDFAGEDGREIVDQGAVGLEGLGADAGASGNEVGRGDLGEEALEGLDEGWLGQRAVPFIDTVTSVLAGHAPEAGEGDRCGEVAQADVGVTVAFTCKGKDGVGAGVDSTRDAAGEVHSEERKARVGNGIDEGVHQGGALGYEVIVFPPEGDDHYSWGVAGHAGDAVAEAAGAVDGRAGGKCSA
jgi:hypothetical protein